MLDPKGADRVEGGVEATLGAEAGYSRPFGCLDCRGEAGLPHRFGELELSRIHPLMVAQARRVACRAPRPSRINESRCPPVSSVTQTEYHEGVSGDGCHVLFTVHLVGHGATDDLAAETDSPEQLAGAGVKGVEEPFAHAGEQYV